jgi:TonB family protein
MKKIFGALFFFWILGVFAFAQETKPEKSPASGSGSGIGSGTGSGSSTQPNKETNVATPATGIRILSKPRANYTDAAKENGIEGTVIVRVTFLANGQIGSVTPVRGLGFGLTEQAIAAARNLRFEPASKNGQPYSVTKMVEYVFFLGLDENDENLEKKARIIENLPPEYPSNENFKGLKGKVKLEVFLIADGRIQIGRVISELPKEFEEKAIEAASKIKFEPAIHKNGNAVSQRKEIEYEFKP